MKSVYLWSILIIAVLALFYAQIRVSAQTSSPLHAWITRGVLLATGIAFGWVAATWYSHVYSAPTWMGFVSGMGLVHVPAAAILFLKGKRSRAQGSGS